MIYQEAFKSMVDLNDHIDQKRKENKNLRVINIEKSPSVFYFFVYYEILE